MAAWKHNSVWNDSSIEKYRTFATRRAVKLYNQHEVIDCANLCLKVLIDFASGNGLPVVIRGRTGSKNVQTTLGSNLPEWSTAEAFMKAVLDGIEANEIIDGHGSSYKNTLTVAVSDMQPGDMLGHLSEAPVGSRAGTWGHMQLVASTSLRSPYGRAIPTSGRAEIYQGNLAGFFWSSPTTVQKGNYYFRRDLLERGAAAGKLGASALRIDRKTKSTSAVSAGHFYYRREGQAETDAAKMWTDKSVTPVRWNFGQFNRFGLIYDYGPPSNLPPSNIGYA